MEAAGRGAGRGGRRAGAAGPGADRLRQGQQRRRRPGRGAAAARDGLRGRGAGALRGDACPTTSTPGWRARARSSTRSSAPASRARRASRRRRRSRRSTAAARRSSPATSPPASTPRAARSRGSRSRPRLTVSFHAAKVGHRVAPGKWHTGELGSCRSASPTGAPVEPAAGEIDPPSSAWRRAAAPRSTKFSSGQVTIAGGSRGLTGAVQMSSLAAIRAGAGYATVAVPADLEPIFEQGQPEVMSVGCPGGDGCLAPASAKALLRAFEGAAAGVLGPGLGRDPGSVELAREVARRDRGPAGPRRRRPQRLRRRPGADRRAGSADVLTPHAGELGRLLGRDSERDRRPPPRLRPRGRPRRRRGRRPQGRRHDRHRRRAASRSTSSRPRPGHRRDGRRALRASSRRCSRAGLEPFAAACAAVLAHARAGRDAAARIGAAESVIATDVIEVDPGGDAARLAPSNNLVRDEDRRRDHGRRRAHRHPRGGRADARSSCSPRPTSARSRSSTPTTRSSASSASPT